MCNIFNMNKILVQFNIVSNFTINLKNKKIIHICKIENEKNYFTIILTYTINRNSNFLINFTL